MHSVKRTSIGEQDQGQLYGEEMKTMDPRGWSGGLGSDLASCGEVGSAGGRDSTQRRGTFPLPFKIRIQEHSTGFQYSVSPEHLMDRDRIQVGHDAWAGIRPGGMAEGDPLLITLFWGDSH